METKKQPLSLSESVRKALLRDAGHAPEDWHPDAHFRRETPPGPPLSSSQERTVTDFKPDK